MTDDLETRRRRRLIAHTIAAPRKWTCWSDVYADDRLVDLYPEQIERLERFLTIPDPVTPAVDLFR